MPPFTLTNHFAQLGQAFFQSINPSPVEQPELFLWNQTLADELSISASQGIEPEELAQYFSGNRLLPGSRPLAMAYAGHQFGNFVPQLGDGRAHVLGDVLDREGRRRELQLKGSGRTVFSRNGDGRYALGPAIREFIMSEAMHALGVPTTRSLALVKTATMVMRDTPQPGAVLTRVAASHVRVGSFEFFAARQDHAALRQLADYTIAQHFEHIDVRDPARFIALLQAVMQQQIDLVVHWMRVGFIHGVMNTDNTSVAGETIDYGPCAMLGQYDPKTVYSSIDHWGRYAFGNQANIAQWNMARFAETLMPLIDESEEAAADQLNAVITAFSPRFEQAFHRMMAQKLGLVACSAEGELLIHDLLQIMEEQKLDYTITFNSLTHAWVLGAWAAMPAAIPAEWQHRWRQQLGSQDQTAQQSQQLMRRSNPLLIPRNHHVEQVLAECLNTGLPDATTPLLSALRSPYAETEYTARFQDAPVDGDQTYATYCGT